jgi:hypothetical protein
MYKQDKLLMLHLAMDASISMVIYVAFGSTYYNLKWIGSLCL